MTSSGTWCVLVAAGEGARLGGDRPKAFAPLAGRALLAESLERLDGSDWVDAIVVVVPEGWEEPAILLSEELVASKVSAVVVGGATRADSVAAGVAEVPLDALVILVHDAARPLVDEATLERLLSALATGADGVIPVISVTDTVKRVAGDRVVETVDRDGLVVAQTPQAFVADRLRSALAGEHGGATDCASLVEQRGGRVAVVPGSSRLLKVTTRDDLGLVELMLQAERRP